MCERVEVCERGWRCVREGGGVCEMVEVCERGWRCVRDGGGA